uniref:NADH dehydrogenase subunit 6 n=1 Tax=Chamberlainia hainesiana TaxID=1264661 RepID=A0A513X0B0_9BIVA|nr:NADH dehydrogenase subunit 6 [Chamberlainia hainesiana]
MTLTMITLMTLTLLTSCITPTHPLTMSITVLLLALNLSAALAFFTIWYAYMLYMVTVGGILVMFLYISSLSPNTILSLKPTPLQLMILLNTTFLLFTKPTPTPSTVNTQIHNNPPEEIITFFLKNENTSLFFLLTCLLLFSMSVVTTLLSKTKAAPMRGSHHCSMYYSFKKINIK